MKQSVQERYHQTVLQAGPWSTHDGRGHHRCARFLSLIFLLLEAYGGDDFRATAAISEQVEEDIISSQDQNSQPSIHPSGIFLLKRQIFSRQQSCSSVRIITENLFLKGMALLELFEFGFLL